MRYKPKRQDGGEEIMSENFAKYKKGKTQVKLQPHIRKEYIAALDPLTRFLFSLKGKNYLNTYPLGVTLP